MSLFEDRYMGVFSDRSLCYQSISPLHILFSSTTNGPYQHISGSEYGQIATTQSLNTNVLRKVHVV